MKLIDLKVLRDFREIRAHVGAIVLALALAMTMPSGLEMALLSLLHTRDTFTGELRLADLEIRMLPEDIHNLPDWSDIPGLESAEARLMMPGTVELKTGATVSAVTIFLQSPKPGINQLRLVEGEMFPAGATELAVAERSLSQYHGVGIGDTLNVVIGKTVYRQELKGIVSSPEFLIVAANPEYFLPEKGSLAVVYTSLDRVFDNLGFTMVNDLLFKYKPGTDPDAVKTAILGKLEGRTLERVISADQHLSRKHIALDHEIFSIFQPAISLVLGLMAFALVLINIDRLIRRQQKEIGALLAIGYSAFQVIRAYLMAALWLSLAGILVGTLGSIGFRSAFLKIYSDAHGLAYLESRVYPEVLARGAFFVLVIAVLSTLAATAKMWKATPRSLMRSAPPSGKHIERVGQALSLAFDRFPLGMRLGIRNIFRNFRLSTTTIGAVALALSVGVAYLVCLESMGSAIIRSFADQRWDRAANFLYPTLDEEYLQIRLLPGVEKVEPFVRAQGQLITSERNLDSSVLGMKTEDSLRTANLSGGRMAKAPGELVIGEDLSRRLKLQIGDKVTLQLRSYKHPATVVGIKSDVLLGESLISLPWAQELLELEDQATGVFIAGKVGADMAALDQSLQKLDFVGRVTLREQLVHDFKTVLQDIRKLVMLVAFIALGVAVLFIVANLNMTMSERTGEFANLRAMGYDQRIISQILFTEAIGQITASLLLVAPLSYLMASYLNHLASQAWFSQPTAYPLWIFAAVAGGVLALTPIGLLPALRFMQNMNLIQALRARVIE